MIKVEKNGKVYLIPENQVMIFKYRGFNIVESPIESVVINDVQVEIETVTDIITDKSDSPLSLWQMKTIDLVNMAMDKGISLTGKESRKEIIEKIK